MARHDTRDACGNTIHEWLESAEKLRKKFYWVREEVCASALHKTIMNADRRLQVEFVRAVVARTSNIRNRLGPPVGDFDIRYANLRSEKDFPGPAVEIVADLIRRTLPFEAADILFIVKNLADLKRISEFSFGPLRSLVGHVERHVKNTGLDDGLERQLKRLCRAMAWSGRADEQRLITRLERLMEPETGPLEGGEPWAEQVVRDLSNKEKKWAAWKELLNHCRSATGSSPSSKWIATAKKHLEAIGADGFRKGVLSWLPLIDKPRTSRPVGGVDWRWREHLDAFISETNSDILKGIVWCCGLEENADLARALTALALSSYRKVPGIGPRLVKVGNACIGALGNMPGMDSVAQLAVLKTRVKFGTAQKLIEKSFNIAAEKAGLPRDEIEEMAVPTYGLDEPGRRKETFGDYTAEILVTGSDAAEIRWSRADGKTIKSVPAAVKKESAEDLKELTQACKDIQAMLPAQRERIDSLFLAQESWPFNVWRERYLDHPLIAVIARALIWSFTKGGRTIDGLYHDSAILDVEGLPIKWLDNETRVALWHPIGRPVDEVMAWRRRLEAVQVRQPFKQAHREIYVLTDAELNTRVYSNRFAAHVLRQHQFNALCAARAWKNKLRLLVDAEYPPASRTLPNWGLRAEFWIEGIGDNYGADTNDSGVFHRIATDQVRFYCHDAATLTAHAGGGGYGPGNRAEAPDPIPLDQIPPLVFSEIMRDVDLFVGVASVGNDPAWQDGGPDGRFRDYWSSYAFGNLSETAKTRRDVLAGLIPRLKIAGRCSLAEKFLVVRGDIRTYKIHLGSGNILMEPNDQYLCIVPGRSPAKSADGRGVFLPFEGDERLAVILSKALLLADDRKITDPTITRQIG